MLFLGGEANLCTLITHSLVTVPIFRAKWAGPKVVSGRDEVDKVPALNVEQRVLML